MISSSDLASLITSTTQQKQTRTHLEDVSYEATTGQVRDQAKHLNGRLLTASLFDRKIELSVQHQFALRSATTIVDGTQFTIEKIQNELEELRSQAILTSELDNDTNQSIMSQTSTKALRAIYGLLNSEISGRKLFSGNSNENALPSITEFQSAVDSEIMGETSAQGILSTLDTWFNSNTHGYSQDIYQGSEMEYSFMISETATVEMNITADSLLVRNILKGIVSLQVATNEHSSLAKGEKSELISNGIKILNRSIHDLVDARGSIGVIQSRLEASKKNTESELAFLRQERASLTAVDQYQAVAELEAASTNLDLMYRIASRQSALSLGEYLR